MSPLKALCRVGLGVSVVVAPFAPFLDGRLFLLRFLFLLEAPPAASAFPLAPVRGAEVMVELLTELLMSIVRSEVLYFAPGGYAVVSEEEHLLPSDSGDGGATCL